MGFHSLQSDFSFASISISVIPRVQGKKIMFIFGAGFPEPYQQDIFESHIKSDTGLPSELLPGSFLPPRTSPELKSHYLPALTGRVFLSLFPHFPV